MEAGINPISAVNAMNAVKATSDISAMVKKPQR